MALAYNDDAVFKSGWYTKPHGLMIMLEEGRISKSAYLLMDFLLAFENRHRKPDETFFCADEHICKTGLLSPKTLIKARRELKYKSLIDIVKKGYTNSATVYRILINKMYYGKGGNVKMGSRQWRKGSKYKLLTL